MVWLAAKRRRASDALDVFVVDERDDRRLALQIGMPAVASSRTARRRLPGADALGSRIRVVVVGCEIDTNTVTRRLAAIGASESSRQTSAFLVTMVSG